MSIVSCIDLETTGLDQSKGDRIIEIAIISYDSDSQKIIEKYVQRIDPERSIAAAAQAVHGISYSDLAGMPKWEMVAPNVHRILSKADFMIAHNMNFDGPFVAAELLRVGFDVPDVIPFCTMENGRWATFDGKYPRLKELCFALDVEYDDDSAHAADYDVTVTMQCFWRAAELGFFTLPGIHASQVAA